MVAFPNATPRRSMTDGRSTRCQTLAQAGQNGNRSRTPCKRRHVVLLSGGLPLYAMQQHVSQLVSNNGCRRHSTPQSCFVIQPVAVSRHIRSVSNHDPFHARRPRPGRAH